MAAGPYPPLRIELGFPGGSVVMNLPAMQEMRFSLWVEKMPWRKKWQHIPLFLPWKIPWTEESGGLPSLGSQRVEHNLAMKQNNHRTKTKHTNLVSFLWGSKTGGFQKLRLEEAFDRWQFRVLRTRAELLKRIKGQAGSQSWKYTCIYIKKQ